MPDEELPPAPSESADETAKAETIRITLPAKSETPTAKRETVRINLPGKSAGSPLPPPGATPKKETTKISMGGPTPGSAAEGAPEAPRPFVPPPPRPPSQGVAPIPPSRPMAGAPAGGPPKPPSLSKPTIPLKPAIAPSGIRPPGGAPMKPGAPGAAQPAEPAEPVTQKAAAPKKETARITLPQGAQGGMPKATVKMQQTQPLVRQPAASSIQTSPVIQSMPASYSSASSSPDATLNILAIVAFVISLGAAVLAFLSYSGSSLS